LIVPRQFMLELTVKVLAVDPKVNVTPANTIKLFIVGDTFKVQLASIDTLSNGEAVGTRPKDQLPAVPQLELTVPRNLLVISKCDNPLYLSTPLTIRN
jgi:hypothetical protein